MPVKEEVIVTHAFAHSTARICMLSPHRHVVNYYNTRFFRPSILYANVM